MENIAIYIYVVGMLVVTFILKRGNNSDFMNASGQLGAFAIGFSVFASLFSSYNIMLSTVFAYLYGNWLFLVMGGLFVGMIIVAVWGGKILDNPSGPRFLTLVDYFNFKYGKGVSTLVHWILVFKLFLFIILQVKLNTVVFSALLGWGEIPTTLFIVGVVLGYSIIGGFKTIVMTDIFQAILTLGVILLAWQLDTSSITTEKVAEDLSDGSVVFGAIAMAVVQLLSITMNPELWQRVYAACSKKAFRYGIAIAIGMFTIVLVNIISIGMNAKHSGIKQVDGQSRIEFFVMIIESAKDSAPLFSIVAVSLFAASMSTLDSTLFAVSSQIAKSGAIVGYREPHSDKSIRKRTILWMIVVSVVGGTASLTIEDFLSAFYSLMALATIIPVLVVMTKLLKMSRAEVFIALLVGIGAFVTMNLTGTTKPIEENMDVWAAVTALYPSGVLVGYALVQRLFFIFVRRIRLHRDR